MSLYHYTDAHGLMGIIQNNILWATDVGFLNDSQEMLAGMELIKRRCAEILETIDSSHDPIEKAAAGLYKKLPEIVTENLVRRNVYIVSFSAARDNLRQWMAYCPQNAGYAIEFDAEKILIDGPTEDKTQVKCRLEKVDYSEDEIENLISLKSMIELVGENLANSQSAALRRVNDLIFHCCAIKTNAFHDERETRLIIQSNQAKSHTSKYRSRAGLIIPYFEYPIQTSWIKEITIGPNINRTLARKGLEDFLHKYQIKCKVQDSECSLRVF